MFCFDYFFLSLFLGVCLYDIAELLVPCFKNEDEEEEEEEYEEEEKEEGEEE